MRRTMLYAGRRAAAIARVAAVLVLVPAAAHAQSDPVVWVDKRVSLQGRRVSLVQPVANQSKFEIPEQTLVEIREALETAFKDKGLLAAQPDGASSPEALQVRAAVIAFKTGDPVSRWVGLGFGAAACTIRLQLLDPSAKRYVADVVQTRVVDTGGFFTIGVDNTIHRSVAEELAEVVEKLLKGGG